MRRLLLSLAVSAGILAGAVGTSGQEPKKAAPAEAPKNVAGAKMAVPAIRVAPQANVPDAVVNQWEQQLAPQFRMLLRGEMHFMRLVTKLKRTEYEKISAEVEPAVKVAIRKYAESMQRGGEESNPQGTMSEAITKAVASNLSPEQSAHYKKEIELRDAARKRLAITNLVAMTDKLLILSPEQREKLSEILTGNWDDSWYQTQIFMYGGQFFPRVPDAKIEPILTELQRKVWRSANKQQVRFGFSVALGRGGGLQMEEENWDDAPEQKPEVKTDAKDGGPPKPSKEQ